MDTYKKLYDDFDKHLNGAYYRELRRAYLPKEKIELLLVGESPPPFKRNKERRFFYNENLDLQHDALYKAVASAIYGRKPGFDVQQKKRVLLELRDHGFWLVDLIDFPLKNFKQELRVSKQLTEDQADDFANDLLLNFAVPNLAEQCETTLKPRRGTIACLKSVYSLIARSPHHADKINVLNSGEGLPFPSDYESKYPEYENRKQEFIGEMRKLLIRKGWNLETGTWDHVS